MTIKYSVWILYDTFKVGNGLILYTGAEFVYSKGSLSMLSPKSKPFWHCTSLKYNISYISSDLRMSSCQKVEADFLLARLFRTSKSKIFCFYSHERLE